MTGPFERLYSLFWQRYLERTEDEELLQVIQPYYAWRALVVAHPIWYPSLSPSVRRSLFTFIETVLSAERVDPQRVGEYIT
jgi:hypothetical protein